MGRLLTYLGGATRNAKRKLSSVFIHPAMGSLGQDALRPGTRKVAKAPKAKAIRKLSPKQFAKSAGPPVGALVTPFEASTGGAGPALGKVVERQSPASFVDDMLPWSDAVDEGIGGSGSSSAAGLSGQSYGETAAGLSGGYENSIPGGSYSDDTSLSGPMAELWAELKDGATELGISLEEYADRLLREYPWMAATLGVATGAALIALLYSLGSGAVATSTAAKKKKTTTKRKAGRKPSYMSKAEHDAWKATRGKSGSVSMKEFHTNIWLPPPKPKAPKRRAVGRTGRKPAGHPKTGRKKKVRFKDKKTGKWVEFYAKS